MKSMLDDDFYKFTMCQALLEIAPDTTSEHAFINRGNHAFTHEFFTALGEEIAAMADLKATPEELQWLSENPVMKPWFVDYIENYRYDPDEVICALRKVQVPVSSAMGGGYVEQLGLSINIHGPMRRTILWEVKLMARISELYFKYCDTNWDDKGQQQRIIDKAAVLDGTGCPYIGFSTRRRRNYKSQDRVVKTMKDVGANFAGTSNMHLAMKHDVKCMGTTAHEWDQIFSVIGGLRNAPKFAMDAWVKVYGGSLGIALSDTYGSDSFFRCFGMQHAKLYDGTRNDSGDPFVYTDKAVANNQRHKIDPMTKIVVFSNALRVPLADGRHRHIPVDRNPVEIAKYCRSKTKCGFGIGTDLSNDYDGWRGVPSPALNMVIKARKINGQHVVKLSDDVEKATGDPDAIRVANWVHRGLPLDTQSE